MSIFSAFVQSLFIFLSVLVATSYTKLNLA